MTPVVQGCYYGYRGKQADSDDDLPRSTWWNLLPGHALEEAGRGKAIFQAQDKKPPFSVRHPSLTAFGGILGGAFGGSMLGAGLGAVVDINSSDNLPLSQNAPAGYQGPVAYPSAAVPIGAVIGGGVGALLGGILAIRRSLKHTHEEAKSLEDQGLTKEVSEKARSLLEEKSKKSRVLHSLYGFLGSVVGRPVGPANVMSGRTSQLRKLTGDTNPDAARLLAGLGHIPYAAMVTDPIQGWKSVSDARKSIAR